MVKGISSVADPQLFNRLTGTALQAVEKSIKTNRLAISQKHVLLEMLAEKQGDSGFFEAFERMIQKISDGRPFSEASVELKSILPHSAAIKQTSLGTAVMAEGWKKPIVFPSKGSFKFAGWIDNPKEVNTKELWEAAYGVQPPLIFGAVGNSNIKPEQVNGGCSLTKQELSQKYEGAIKDFYQPIIAYLKEQGAKSEDIGFAFAHSDCGVDRAAREITETNNLRGFAVTPTRYTQYLRGKEMPACEEFPNGFIMADFPFPTVLTRDMTQIDDYAHAYGIMVGKKNPLGVFGGGEHAFVRDAKEAFIGTGAAEAIPVDIMRDKFGIVIPATDKNGVVTNAARDIIERINGNPYEQYRFAFNNFLPGSGLKNDIAQYVPQAAVATIAYAKLAQAGKIGTR